MNFLTTKQIAELWGVTPRRITVLASQGRIPGAKQIDGRWFIPDNAIKPLDPRVQSKTKAEEDDPYLFPFPLCIITSEEKLVSLNAEQKELYRLDVSFEKGDFTEARKIAESLLPSSNPYIRIGALYLLPFICMSLFDFKATDKYSLLFRLACQNEKEHKADIDTLLIEFEGEMSNFSGFIQKANALDVYSCSSELLPFISAYKLFSLVASYRITNTQPDVSVYEILCRTFEKQGYSYDVMFLHYYLSLYYLLSGEKEKEYQHLRKTFDLAIELDAFFTLSLLFFCDQEAAEYVLKDYPPKHIQRLEELSDGQVKARNAYTKYLGKRAMLSKLNEGDYKLLSYCINNSSIEDMAKGLGITRSGVNKRLAGLYGKLGVKSKKELSKKFLDSVLNWN